MAETSDLPVERVCPHCGVELARVPRRRTSCRACGEAILVRGSPVDGRRHLVTEAQAEALGQLWDAREDERRILERLDELGYVGRSVGDLLGRVGERLGRPASLVEALLDAYDGRAHDAEARREWSVAASLWRQRAIHARSASQPFLPSLTAAIRCDLAWLAEVGAQLVEIASEGCPACQRHAGFILPLELALGSLPIPHHDCSCTTARDGISPSICFCRFQTSRG